MTDIIWWWLRRNIWIKNEFTSVINLIIKAHNSFGIPQLDFSFCLNKIN